MTVLFGTGALLENQINIFALAMSMIGQRLSILGGGFIGVDSLRLFRLAQGLDGIFGPER